MPEEAFTVTVTSEEADAVMVAGDAVAVVTVVAGGAETVIVTTPLEALKFPVGVKAALTLLAPIERLEPFTVRVATPAVGVAVPREVFPSVKVTVPAGWLVPVAARTVAVRTVDAVCTMVAGAAVRTVVVATREAVTATVAVADAFARVALP